MNKFMKKVLAGLPYVLFLLAFLLVANVVLALAEQRIPSFFGYSVLHIKSGSMEPSILTGDIILVKRTDPEELAVGDVITFAMTIEEGGVPILATVTHRITGVIADGGDLSFTTKGDHNNAADDWEVPADAVIGRYVGRSVALGNLYLLVMSGGPGLIYLGAVVVFLLIGLSEGASIVKAVAEHRKNALETERRAMIAAEKERLLAETVEENEISETRE